MDRGYADHDYYLRPAKAQLTLNDISTQTILVYIFAGLFLLHQVLHQFDVIPLSISDGFWNLFVAATPSFVVLGAGERKTSITWSQAHAAKAASMRKMLGLNNRGLLEQVAAPHSLLQRMSITSASTLIRSSTPPGLGNWDNSCYQNSVLQGLTSLKALRTFLLNHDGKEDTMRALREITDMLRDAQNNGKHVWTPAKLKSMSSWQQQDAQEYYSKIMDELEKDVVKARPKPTQVGCEAVLLANSRQQDIALPQASYPLEGMLAQQVVCTTCGFSEGLSIIPFNCLTLPLDNKPEIKLEDCLAEYTKQEPITGVECAKCTLLKTRQELQRLTNKHTHPANSDANVSLPVEVLAQVSSRLDAVESALDGDDFSDETLSKICQISKKARVASTKTRQALLARTPADLVLHFNRSVFDEMTGSLRKNYAAVRYPAVLDLSPWILKGSLADLPREDMWKYMYRIKAVVTHSGRHENGHYVAYREAPVYDEEELSGAIIDLESDRKQQWWRLSDETGTAMTESSVLDEGGVFMLFYERFEQQDLPQSTTTSTAAISNAALQGLDEVVSMASRQPNDTIPPLADGSTDSILRTADVPAACISTEAPASEASLTEDELELSSEGPVVEAISKPSPLLMRTANVERNNDEHWTMGRFVAAS